MWKESVFPKSIALTHDAGVGETTEGSPNHGLASIVKVTLGVRCECLKHAR